MIGSQKHGLIINIFSSKNKTVLKDSHAAVTFLFGMKGFIQMLSDSFKNKAIKIISFFCNDDYSKYMKDENFNDINMRELSTLEEKIIDEVKKLLIL